MNKTILILLGVVVVMVVVGSGIWFAIQPSPENTVQEPVTFPTSSNTNSTGTNQQISFLENPEVYPDPNNPGTYYIQYRQPDESEPADMPYLIQYIEETRYFNIGLIQEPLGENRRKAEVKIMQVVGITKEQMCYLNYAVYASNSVNSQYSGQNLGFSFCPDAVRLPQ